MDSNIPPHVGHHPPATTSFSSSLGSGTELDTGGPATPTSATLFAAPLAPSLHDSSPFSPPTGLGDGDGGTAPSSASSSSSSESPGGGGGHQNLPPPSSSTSTMQTAARGLGMMGMSGGYADSLKILFSKPSGHEEVLSEDEARRRREQLNRRPSYRMILKDLETVDKTMKTEPEDSPPDASSLGSTVDTTPGTSTNNLNGPGDSLHVQIPRSGLLPSTSSAQQQQLQNSNGAMGSSPYNSPLSNNLLLGQGPLHPMPLNGGDISLGDYNTQLSLITAASLANVARTSQITPTSAFEGSTGDMHTLKGMQDHSFSQGVDWTSSLMSSTGYDSSPSPTGGHGGGMGGEDEGTRKRQVRLLKNREAAKECRRKKKEYVKCLENRVAVLENQNKALIEELKALKELYCRKEKSDM